MKYSWCILLLVWSVVGCASTVGRSDIRVPFEVYGKVLDTDDTPVAGAWVGIDEYEQSGMFSTTRVLGEARTERDGTFRVIVKKQLLTGRFELGVIGRSYLKPNGAIMSDTVSFKPVKVPGPNILRVRRGFVPAKTTKGELVKG